MGAHKDTLTRALDRARELGTAHGSTAGQWVSVPDVRATLTMINAESPDVRDMIGGSDPLSGEYADGMTPVALWDACGLPREEYGAGTGELERMLCDEYESAHWHAFSASVARTLRDSAGEPGHSATI